MKSGGSWATMALDNFYDLADVKDYFGEGPPIIVEDRLSTGEGTGSTIILLKQYEGANTPRSHVGEFMPVYRRLVLKTPLDSGRDIYPFGLRHNELKWLQLFSAAQHIVDLVSFRDNSARQWVPGTQYPPFTIMEHLGGGSLERFMREAQRLQLPISARCATKVFLCLARACEEMANTEEPMSHNDFTADNVMLDDPIPGDPEHNFFPIMKVIDFEHAGAPHPEFPDERHKIFDSEYIRLGQLEMLAERDGHAEDAGVAQNMLDIGKIMTRLITGDDLGTLFEHRQAIVTRSYPRCPSLSDALALLICRCLAPRPHLRPAPRFLTQELRRMVDRYNQKAPDQQTAGESVVELNALLWGW